MSTKLTKVAKGLVAAGLMAAASAYAASDVGLVRQLAGNVSYDSGSGSMQAKPYMKVRQGDRFSVAAGAQVQVIYFDSGRQESFAGPASFVAGAKQSAVTTTVISRIVQSMSSPRSLRQSKSIGECRV